MKKIKLDGKEIEISKDGPLLLSDVELAKVTGGYKYPPYPKTYTLGGGVYETGTFYMNEKKWYKFFDIAYSYGTKYGWEEAKTTCPEEFWPYLCDGNQ